MTTIPKELSQFLRDQAAQMNAEPDAHNAPYSAAEQSDSSCVGVTPMQPDFQLMHPRRVRWSMFATDPNCGWTHMSGFKHATPEQEAWHRIHDPEGGLHPDDLSAYRASQRGLALKFIARLHQKLWPAKPKVSN
jgi:hypothetical protein